MNETTESTKEPESFSEFLEQTGDSIEECDHQYYEVSIAPCGVRCVKCGHFIGDWE